MVYILTIILGQSCTEVDITMPKGPKMVIEECQLMNFGKRIVENWSDFLA